MGALLVGCGGVAERELEGDDGSYAGGQGLVPVATRCSSDSQGERFEPKFDPKFDLVEEYADECQAVCTANQPPPVPLQGFLCSAEPVTACVERCRDAVVNVNRGCADCLIDHLVWPYLRAYCSSWECVCDGGVSSFPSPSAPVCLDVCSTSLEYQAKLRQNTPRPPDVGRPPLRSVEFSDLSLTGLASTSDPNAFIAAGRRGETAVVGRFRFDGDTEWLLELGKGNLGLAQRVDGRIAVVALNEAEQRLWLLDEWGTIVVERTPPQRIDQLGTTSNGELFGIGMDQLMRFDDDLDVESTWAAPANIGGLRLLSLRDGSLVVGGLDRVHRYLLSQDGFTQDWESTLAGPVTGLVDAGDRIVAAAANTRTSFGGEYLVRWLSVAGEPLVDVQPAGAGVLGRVTVARRVPGGVILVGGEDPASSGRAWERRYTPDPHSVDECAGACSVYGCESLFVRELDDAGGVTWLYQRRQDAGRAVDALVLPNGRLRVLGVARREAEVAQVLDFER